MLPACRPDPTPAQRGVRGNGNPDMLRLLDTVLVAGHCPSATGWTGRHYSRRDIDRLPRFRHHRTTVILTDARPPQVLPPAHRRQPHR